MRRTVTPFGRQPWRTKPMTDKNVSIKIGPGFPGLLTILFIALKLTGYISWSWWWVLSPIWIPLAIVLAIWSVIAIFAMVIFLTAGKR